MYATFDTDSSFFNVTVGGDTDITTDVIELSITEEIGQLLHGNITFFDPAWYYSKLFNDGNKFTCSWGYKNKNQTINDILVKIKNPEEVQGVNFRTGLNVFASNPKYNFGNNGVNTTTVGFYGSEAADDTREMFIYNSGTKGTVIQNELSKLGVTSFLIKFDTQNDKLTTKGGLVKYEKGYKFLLRISKEWQCTFMIGSLPSGNLIGCFVQSNLAASKEVTEFMSKATGSVGNTKLFEYGIGATYPNIISGNIEHHIGENGQGDNVSISIINGKQVVTRRVAQQGTITTLRLDEDKIRKFASERGEDFNIIMKNVIQASSFDSQVYQDKKVKDFFTAEKVETAPQGLGYSGSFEVIGDPTLCIPLECKFGYGFPPAVQKSGDDFKIFLKSVEHRLNSEGYRCTISVADIITAYGSYVNA